MQFLKRIKQDTEIEFSFRLKLFAFNEQIPMPINTKPLMRSGPWTEISGFATYKLHVPVQAVAGLECFATALADKNSATVLPTLVLVEGRQ